MKGFQLQFYMDQNKRHRHLALWEWFIEAAHSHGIRGATAFMGESGYGHQGRIHSAHLFELGDQPAEVTMIVTEEESEKMFSLLKAENIYAFFVKIPVEFGTLGDSMSSPP
ncbi:conserved hypothetical protein; putative GlnB-like domain [Herminiimonas arsenicoxydans]|uniref:Uncharacterized protein n=1 Tax=Herminiimonas arsenicoxydans TaxID=204773 RepID=A4G5Q6_HERAR|nr:conserved hypothetical protein; putative GlnB-like domain [Herminiimonas arsenicoxydans]